MAFTVARHGAGPPPPSYAAAVSPPDGIRLPPGIRRGGEQAAIVVSMDSADRAGQPGPRRPRFDAVPPLAQPPQRARAQPRFGPENAGQGAVRPEAVRRTVGGQ